jgi:hypothetical protein
MASVNFNLWAHILRFALPTAFAWGAIYWRRWQKTRQEDIAQGWPSADGLIVSAKVEPIPKTTRFNAVLQYTYFRDEYRSGRYNHEFMKEEDADEFVRQMRDKRVQIRYKESNPDKSVLEQSVVEQHVLIAPRFG